MTGPCRGSETDRIRTRKVERQHICRYVSQPWRFNTLKSEQNGRYFVDDIFQSILLKGNYHRLIQIWLKYVSEGLIDGAVYTHLSSSVWLVNIGCGHGLLTAICVLIPISWIMWRWNRCSNFQVSWWRHQMETFSALLALCAGNSPVSDEFPSQRPVTRSFNVFFDLCPN